MWRSPGVGETPGHLVRGAGTHERADLEESGQGLARPDRDLEGARADWLAFRGYTDLSRIHGPAGLSIGAKTPAEIAVSILAEAMSDLRLKNHQVTPAH